jgi:hypothetical protein
VPAAGGRSFPVSPGISDTSTMIVRGTQDRNIEGATEVRARGLGAGPGDGEMRGD